MVVAGRQRFAAAALAFGAAGANADPQTPAIDLLRDPIWFTQAACPEPELLAQLRTALRVTMSPGSCCAFRGMWLRGAPDRPQALAALGDFLVESADFSSCQAQPAEEFRRQRSAQRASEEAAAAALQHAEVERARNLPSLARAMPSERLCASWGAAVRGELSDEVGKPTRGAIATLEREMRRRGLNVSRPLTLAQDIRIGSSECQLFASFGAPSTSSRTVWHTGSSTQHAYGGRRYVYTSRGVVIGWQD